MCLWQREDAAEWGDFVVDDDDEDEDEDDDDDDMDSSDTCFITPLILILFER